MNAWPDGAYALCPGWSAVEASGPDAGAFLQNFCTNDVLALADGASCEAMFTDVKAHVLAYTWVARLDAERYVALLMSGRAEELRAHLDRYLIRERVELRLALPEPWTIAATTQPLWSVPLDAFGAGVTASLAAPPNDLSPLADDDFHRLRIGLGIPLDGVDVDDRNLPQEVDRNEQAISFRKGCYLGQEPVARIDALGRVNWLLRRVEVDGPPPAHGAELAADGKVIGRITSCVATENGSLALAYVRREQSHRGAMLTVGELTARVV
ncbi:putative global regulator [Botrimarina colliarenosi]|uniref:Putative global regulator n=1 Tax=Botrimarina colliarenosi TaxID=2528001 RepID=A0A5C6AJF8_9BACT|nr:hypothetical protein [Botrimarina colliarenosi]TWT99779.1 putative global regulator [Botrimarina colliarenosi]